MRDYRVIDHWYEQINKFFPDFSEEVKKDLAITICDELDYIAMLGIHRPGGLFEKLKLPPPKNEPAGIIDGDFLKFLQ